jgi:hypothetical protein
MSSGVITTQGNKATAKSTWQDLCEAFELEMERMVANKTRGAGREEGTVSPSTRSRYRGIARRQNELGVMPWRVRTNAFGW